MTQNTATQNESAQNAAAQTAQNVAAQTAQNVAAQNAASQTSQNVIAQTAQNAAAQTAQNVVAQGSAITHKDKGKKTVEASTKSTAGKNSKKRKLTKIGDKKRENNGAASVDAPQSGQIPTQSSQIQSTHSGALGTDAAHAALGRGVGNGVIGTDAGNGSLGTDVGQGATP
ncbi:kinesin-like protein KIN-10B [Sesbania bispinosa]|nr:kinesin-like protein KIN-10B [Sesbania bispinosa]